MRRRFLGAVIVLVLIPHGGCTVSRTEFLCEDAVAKLDGCCSAIMEGLGCTYVDNGCTVPSIVPSFDVETSRCIILASCSELRNGACQNDICR